MLVELHGAWAPTNDIAIGVWMFARGRMPFDSLRRLQAMSERSESNGSTGRTRARLPRFCWENFTFSPMKVKLLVHRLSLLRPIH